MMLWNAPAMRVRSSSACIARGTRLTSTKPDSMFAVALSAGHCASHLEKERERETERARLLADRAECAFAEDQARG